MATAVKRTTTATPTPKRGLLNVGDIVHLVNGGRTLQHYEVLDMDEHFIKFRANIQNAPQTEIVLIPRDKIEALGLPNER